MNETPYIYVPGCDCSFCRAVEQRRRERDTRTILEARISDLSAENLDLRRRVSALERRANDQQTAHNLAAGYVLALATRAGLRE